MNKNSSKTDTVCVFFNDKGEIVERENATKVICTEYSQKTGERKAIYADITPSRNTINSEKKESE